MKTNAVNNVSMIMNERENELVYFALSRLLDDFDVDGVQDINDREEYNEIDTLRERFGKLIAVDKKSEKEAYTLPVNEGAYWEIF